MQDVSLTQKIIKPLLQCASHFYNWSTETIWVYQWAWLVCGDPANQKRPHTEGTLHGTSICSIRKSTDPTLFFSFSSFHSIVIIALNYQLSIWIDLSMYMYMYVHIFYIEATVQGQLSDRRQTLLELWPSLSLVSKLKATKTRMKIRNRRTAGPASGGGFPTCI